MDFIIKFLVILILLAILVQIYLFYRNKMEEKEKGYLEDIRKKIFNTIKSDKFKITTELDIYAIKDLETIKEIKGKLQDLQQIELSSNPIVKKIIKFLEKKEKTLENETNTNPHL